MAYGSWTNIGWLESYVSTGYRIAVYVSYQQDIINNKTKVRVSAVKLTSQNGYRVYDTGGATTAGYGAEDSVRIEKSGLKTAMTQSGHAVEQDLGNSDYEYTHASNGTRPTIVASAKYYVNVSAPGLPPNSWSGVAVTVPNIDRNAPTATASYVSKTYNSITLYLTTTASSSKGRYRLNNGGWTEFSVVGTDMNKTGGGAINKAFTGLSPNTSYKIDVQFYRDYNGLWSNTASVTTTTNKPAVPTAGKVSVSSKTYNSITCAISGFSAGAGGSISKYQRRLGSDGSWVDCSSTFTVSGLSPNTSYTIYVRCMDNYSQYSSAVSTSTTTNKPNVPTFNSIEVKNYTMNTAEIWLSGEYGAGTPSGYIGTYQYQLNGGSWTNCSNILYLSNLSPNTSYSINGRLVDYYGQASNVLGNSFTTSKPGLPTLSSLSVSSITMTSAKIEMSGSYGTGHPSNLSGTYQYKLDNGEWTDCSNSFTLTNLSPYTEYTIQGRLKDYYGQVSSALTEEFTTLQPPAPEKGTVSVSNILSFSATFSWSGFSFGENATWGYYECGIEGKSSKNVGQDTSVTIDNLDPETDYVFYVRLVDNYGGMSEKATVSFTTLIDQVKGYIKQEGQWKSARVFFKQNGEWKKVKKVYKKIDGVWKESFN